MSLEDQDLDRQLARYRARLGDAPTGVTHLAIAEFAELHKPVPRAQLVGRGLLVLAAAIALLSSAVGLAGAGISGGDLHLGRDLLGIKLALGIGWGIAAWRPAQYRSGLLPVSVAAAITLTVLSATTAPSASVSVPLALEASHIPVLLGTAGLWLAGPTGTSRRRPPQVASR